MTKQQHAQGEWMIGANYLKEPLILDRKGVIAVINVSGKSDNTIKATTHLIAAAPRLLNFAKLVAAGNLTKGGFIDAANRVLESIGE